VLHDFGGSWELADPQALASVTLINTGVLIDYSWHGGERQAVMRVGVLGHLLHRSAAGHDDEPAADSARACRRRTASRARPR